MTLAAPESAPAPAAEQKAAASPSLPRATATKSLSKEGATTTPSIDQPRSQQSHAGGDRVLTRDSIKRPPRMTRRSARPESSLSHTLGSFTTPARPIHHQHQKQLGSGSGALGTGAHLPSPLVPPIYEHFPTYNFNRPEISNDDVEFMLYTARELVSLIENDRFMLSGSAFGVQFTLLAHRLLTYARNIAAYNRGIPLTTPARPPATLLYEQLVETTNNARGTPLPGLLHNRSPAPATACPDVVSPPAAVPAASPANASAPPSTERVFKDAKIPIPEHPNYNFIGRILGPRGISVRQLEVITGCGILIRGKGSVKNSEREERLRAKNTPGFEHLNEPLHVVISAEGKDEAECVAKLDRCKERINQLLKPEYDEYKRRQLAQLAMINGNYEYNRGMLV